MAKAKKRKRKFDVPDAKLRRLLGAFEAAVGGEGGAMVAFVRSPDDRGEARMVAYRADADKARTALCRHLTELLRSNGVLV